MIDRTSQRQTYRSRLLSSKDRWSSLFAISLLAMSLGAVIACRSEIEIKEIIEAPDIPSLTVTDETRGAFLGVWGEPNESGSVWFVGGERSEAGETNSLIASYKPGDQIRLEDEREGGLLWWVWGSGADNEVWAAGEEGTILKRSMTDSSSQAEWLAELVELEDDTLDKLIIWGLWGLKTEGGTLDIWAVGGSVRRGGPKGVLLKRSDEGGWRRITSDLLPVESSQDPLKGLNLYKIWGNDERVWIVGEGSLTLTAKISRDETGEALLTEWRDASLQGERPELLFTVTGQSANVSMEGSRQEQGPWVVGGYSEGRAWRWEQESWSEITLPTIAPLNGITRSRDLVVAVGSRGALLAWRPELQSSLSTEIHHQWVRGAESMTLHSAWASPKGEFWIVGGDLTTLKSGVIITPSDWSQDNDPIIREEW